MSTIHTHYTVHDRVTENVPSNANDQPLGFVVVAIVISAFVFMAAPVTVKCERTATQGPVNCTKQTRLLWIFSLPKDNIYNVVGARLASIPGDEYCDPCYRVEFQTAQGIVPLKTAYTNGSSGMSNMVEKVNDFVRGETPATLSVTEPGLFNAENLFWFALWGVGSYVWEQIKEEFSRRKNR